MEKRIFSPKPIKYVFLPKPENTFSAKIENAFSLPNPKMYFPPKFKKCVLC